MCSYSAKRFKRLKDFQKSCFLTSNSNTSFLKTREDGAMLDPYVALFKSFVLLLPQNEHHFKLSGRDTAEKGKKVMIESETGQKLYTYFTLRRGVKFKSRFYSI